MTKKSKSKLVEPDEHLRLDDGSTMAPTGQLVLSRDVVLPDEPYMPPVFVRTNKKISDLPTAPKQMHAVNAIIVYHLFGLDDAEIALATDLTVEQVLGVRESDPYKQMMTFVCEAAVQQEDNIITDVFKRAALHSAFNVVKMTKNEDAAVALRANKEVLDRSGFAPNAADARNGTMQPLRIEIVTDSGVRDVSININAE